MTILRQQHVSRLALAAAIAFTAALPLSSCASKHQTVATTETVTDIDQHRLPPPRMIDISIVNLHDVPSDDPAEEKVVGTIVNEGDRAVDQVAIRVEALDTTGNVMHTVTTPPLAQTIEPFGGKASFEAMIPHDELIAGYHAVAIAR
ncbi:MAG TPA: FxLYD domain-containing protein [Candidatus Binatia bacterium]|jgi:hypothetical protein